MKVVYDMSVSLDGIVAGPKGESGQRLADWIFDGLAERSGASALSSALQPHREIIDESFKTIGAIVMGRHWFEILQKFWGDGRPHLEVPCFVLTHRAQAAFKKGNSSFTFVTDGIESALTQAKRAAGDKNIRVGGTNVARQYLAAGLVDEIQIHLVPVLLGEGIRLFEPSGSPRVELERTRVIAAPGVTHLRFRVVK